MTVRKISSKGWVTIPKEYRKKYQLSPGTKVQFVEHNGIISIIPIPDDTIDAAQGMLKHVGGPSMSEEIVEEHRRARAKEDA